MPLSSSSRPQIPGVVVLAVSAAILGFASILVKASDLGPQAIAFWRLSLGLPLLAALLGRRLWARRRAGEPLQLKPPGWRALALAGVFFAGDLAFWHAGIKITTAANATLLANLTPILVAIAAWFLFQERPTRGMFIAGVLAILGAVCLAGGNVRFAPERVSGDILSALTAVWYTGYILSIRAARKAGAATVEVMFWSAFVGAPIALLVATGFNEPLLPPDPSGWWPLLGAGADRPCGRPGRGRLRAGPHARRPRHLDHPDPARGLRLCRMGFVRRSLHTAAMDRRRAGDGRRLRRTTRWRSSLDPGRRRG
jgi:drug/metabolite transporter (DMT)-like permease